MKKILTLTAIVTAVLVFSNCSSTKKGTASAPPAPAKLTYASNVQALVVANCSPCHIPSKGGRKKDYSTFAAVNGDIDQIIQRIEMHPGDRGFMPFKGTRLSDSTIAVFKQWRTDGLLEK